MLPIDSRTNGTGQKKEKKKRGKIGAQLNLIIGNGTDCEFCRQKQLKFKELFLKVKG